MRFFSFLLFLIILISCKDPVQEQKDTQATTTSEFSIAKAHKILTQIIPANEKEISNWTYYTNLKEFLNKFSKSTPNEALSNALELGTLVKALKDSVKPTILNTPSVSARINLLETESLRLSDMTKISAIKAEEIHYQIDKVFDAFSSLNSKINTVYLQRNLDKNIDLKDFDNLPPLEDVSVQATTKKTLINPKKSVPKKKSKIKKEKASKKLPSKEDLMKYHKKKVDTAKNKKA